MLEGKNCIYKFIYDFIIYKEKIYDYNFNIKYVSDSHIYNIEKDKYNNFKIQYRYHYNNEILDSNFNSILKDGCFLDDKYLIYFDYKNIRSKNNILYDLENKKDIINFNDYDIINNDRIIIGNFNNYYGLINKKGETIVECVYDDITQLNNKLQFKKSNKYGLMNLDGKIIIEPIYDDVLFENSKFIGVVKNDLKI